MKARDIVFIIFSALTLLLMLAVLELNKNTLPGWLLAAAAAVGFFLLHHRLAASGRRLWGALSWVGWIAAFALILLLTWPPVKSVPALPGDPVRTGTVSTRYGDVRGVRTADGEVEIFAGIPYAKPPVGELRWREPQEPEPWDGVLEADRFAPMSMQPTNPPIIDSLVQIVGYHDYEISLNDNYRAPVSEDSLYLNIWRPSGGGEKLPVLVYVHGGSLQTGQPWYADYSGEGLAREGVIVVNMGYRLGVFGFFANDELAEESPNSTTGNYGLLDQIKALEWVRDNIAAFGGDPENVTLAGESAGSASVSALCVSPLASGLFRRAVLESSTVASVAPPHSFRLFDEALASGRELMERYGCATVSELRAIDAKRLVGEANTQHHITVDGYVLAETPYESYKKGIHNEQQLLHGYNAEESAPFIIFGQADMKNYEHKIREYFKEYADEVLTLYPASTNAEARRNWADIYSAVLFTYPHYCLDRLAALNGVPAYEYCFSKQNGRLGAWHSGEEVYCYGNIPDGSRLYDERDRELSRVMLRCWAAFAKCGDPNHDGCPEWTSAGSDSLMGFGDAVCMTGERFLPLYEVLDRMYGWDAG